MAHTKHAEPLSFNQKGVAVISCLMFWDHSPTGEFLFLCNEEILGNVDLYIMVSRFWELP